MESLCHLLASIKKIWSCLYFSFSAYSYFWSVQPKTQKTFYFEREKDKVSDLFEQFVTLLELLSAVFEHGADTIVFPQPLLVGVLLQVYVGETQRPQTLTKECERVNRVGTNHHQIQMRMCHAVKSV